MIQSFQNYLEENPQAFSGDLKNDSEMSVTKSAIDNYWIRQNHKIKIAKKSFLMFKIASNRYSFIVGYWLSEKDRFKIVFKISLSSEKKIGTELNYKKLFVVDSVLTDDDFRTMGIATKIYKLLTSDAYGLSLIGNRSQYFGSRKLWSKLSKSLDVIVDLVDVEKKIVLFRDVVFSSMQL